MSSEILEPLAFNCAYPNSPCSYAHECRQIRHCEYIRTDSKDTRISDLKSEIAEAQARIKELEGALNTVSLNPLSPEQWMKRVDNLLKGAK